MTTIEMTQDRAPPTAYAVRGGSKVRKALLVCGILSSLLYVAADFLGGMRYDGYSFSSQAVSELMAIGAPSKPLVDRIFLAYGVFTLAFGVGVLRDAAGRNRALRITAALLIGYAAFGLTGPTLFPMHQRGVGNVADDLPHIVLTALLVVCLLLAIWFGALSLGRRFRVYSFRTLLVVIVFSALSGLYGARLAAQQPTPGFGIIERIDIYASLAWVAVLAIALLRRPWPVSQRSLQ